MQRRTFLKGVAGILAASQAPAVLSATREFVIGQSLPLTGSNAEFGLDVQAGVHAYLHDLKQRGEPIVISHKVLDDTNKPDKAAENTKALISSGANLLFGYASATISKPCIPLAEKAAVPFYAPFTGARTIHRGSSPLVFTARASYDAEVAKFGEGLMAMGSKRVCVVHYADAVGEENRDTCVEGLAKFGMKCTTVSIQRNAEVPMDTARKILDHHPDTVLFTTLAKPSATLVERVRADSNAASMRMLALSFSGPSQFQSMLGDRAKGIIVSHVVPQPWDAYKAAPLDYQTHNRAAKTGRQPTFAGLEAYVALRGLEASLRKSSGSKGTAILAALKRTSTSVGGYALDFTESPHGSQFVDFTIIRSKGVAL